MTLAVSSRELMRFCYLPCVFRLTFLWYKELGFFKSLKKYSPTIPWKGKKIDNLSVAHFDGTSRAPRILIFIYGSSYFCLSTSTFIECSQDIVRKLNSILKIKIGNWFYITLLTLFSTFKLQIYRTSTL